MIKMNIDLKATEKLVRDLKRMRFELLRKTSEMIVDLSNTLHESYTRSIDELVYDEYTPIKYERTMHLRGAHGALVENVSITGDIKKYSFYIDEKSTDPVDGETWATKADKIEKGSTKMTVGFDRPFVEATQEKLVWETNRLVDSLMKSYEQTIKQVGR